MTLWYRVLTTYSFFGEQKEKLKSAVNLGIVGKESCNKIENGRIVRDYPEELAETLNEAHWKINTVHKVALYLKLDPTTGETTYSLEEPYEYINEWGRLQRRKKQSRSGEL